MGEQGSDVLRLSGVDMVVRHEHWLADIDLDLHPGLNVLAGPTTAGETTLMGCQSHHHVWMW